MEKFQCDCCNVEAGYKKYFAEIYSEAEYLKMNYDACARLKKLSGGEKVIP